MGAEADPEAIEKLLEGWKEEAGPIPTVTCPDIDKIIKTIGEIERVAGRASTYDSIEELAGDIEWSFRGENLCGDLEKLRESNEQLRSLSIFWYEKTKGLIKEGARKPTDNGE